MEESQSDVCSKLWQLDRKHNGFKKGEDYRINLKDSGKGATCKLFSYVDPEKLTNITTYKAFMQLLNNYESDTSVSEEETVLQMHQNRAFLNQCLKTEVMEEALRFLSSRNIVPKGHKKAFKEKLFELWFRLHPRPSGDGTYRSAFEHVFVGETCHGKILGFHNWIRLYLEESQGNVIYKGCKPSGCGDHIIAISFNWNGRNKTFGKTFFVGTSPEFELAIYTVCFLAGNENETKVILGNEIVTITSYHENGQIGACYPKLQGRIQMPGRRGSLNPSESEENSTPEEDQEAGHLDRITNEENQFPARNVPPTQGQILMPQHILIPIEAEADSTSEEDDDTEDQPERARLIIPENNRSPKKNGEVSIFIDDDDFLPRRHERKATKDPFSCNCTIL